MKKMLKVLSVIFVLVLMTGCQRTEKTGYAEIIDLTGEISEETLFPARYKSISEDIVIVFSDADVPVRQYGDAERQYIILVTPLQVVVIRDSYEDSRLNRVASEIANSIKGMNNEEAVMVIIKTMDDIITTDRYESIAVVGLFIVFAALFTGLYLFAGGDDYGHRHSTYCVYRGGSRASYGCGGSSHR
jgi:hypothetical protein